MDLVVMASAFHLISSEPCMPPELCLCVCVLFCLVDCVSHVRCVSIAHWVHAGTILGATRMSHVVGRVHH